MGGSSGSNASDGGRQMKFHSLAHRSPPTVQPRFLMGRGPLPVRGPGDGDPCATTCILIDLIHK